MARQLKVFCTPIGFHDAYVAAPSQKAALDAWGADANLFARGMASVVTDPKLTKEPLAKPGEVVKRLRGTTAEHLAALPTTASRRSASSTKGRQAKPTKPEPKPSRRQLDAAERALGRAEDKYEKAAAAIRDREEALRRARSDLAAQRDAETTELQHNLDDVRADYDRAMERWRG